jgi:hypothetical protein
LDAMMQSLDLVASPQSSWGKDFEEQVANPAYWSGSLFYREIVQTLSEIKFDFRDY